MTDAHGDELLDNEASYFGKQDNDLLRGRSWSSLPIFQHLIQQASNLNKMTQAAMAGRPEPRGLSLACGDMQGEYGFLVQQAGVRRIDAFDLSAGQRDKFFARDDLDSGVEVNYRIADVNAIELEPECYDIVYVQQAYHHLQAIEHVAAQINRALKHDGIFVLVDYVGANFLQRTARQRLAFERIWPFLAERYRLSPQGNVCARLQIPDKDKLSPFEAVRAEEILGVLNRQFEVEHQFLFAGILFPLLEGFAQNYGRSEEDRRLLKSMWDLDRQLIDSGEVEPNFIRAIYRKGKQAESSAAA